MLQGLEFCSVFLNRNRLFILKNSPRSLSQTTQPGPTQSCQTLCKAPRTPPSLLTLTDLLLLLSSRQDPVDKATSAAKPDSEKSTLEKAQDSVKSTADSAAGKAQPGTFPPHQFLHHLFPWDHRVLLTVRRCRG